MTIGDDELDSADQHAEFQQALESIRSGRLSSGKTSAGCLTSRRSRFLNSRKSGRS